MTNIYVSILLIAGLIALNGFFVAAEYSLLTLRKTKIDQFVKQKILGYGPVRKALENLYLIISATQLGSTVCNILLGIFGEPIIEKPVILMLSYLRLQTNLLLDRSFAIVLTILLLSFIQMILGEIIPKTIALQKADFISRLLIIPLNLFVFVMLPFIFITNMVSSLFLRVLKLQPLSEQPMDYSQEEIKIILKESGKNHLIPGHQARLLSNIFALQRIPVSKFMIPKTKLVCFSHMSTFAEIKKSIAQNKHTFNRYPVYFSKNVIVGFINLSDILRFSENGNDKLRLNETPWIREILYVNNNTPTDKVLIMMREKNIHAAVVMNQEEGILGIVTITDIIEFLVNHK